MNADVLKLLAMPKIDAHCHVLDPERFAYASDVAYRPAGQEQGELSSMKAVHTFHGVQHALLVQPNSGYGLDNRCMLDAIASSRGAYKGIAVVANDCPQERLLALKSQGVIGIAFNASLHGSAFYADILPLLKRMAAVNMWANFQVEGDQLLDFLPLMEASGVKTLIDHCGRPHLQAGLQQKGFQALLSLGKSNAIISGAGLAVKLSGFAKFSLKKYPFEDAKAYIDALASSFGLANCLWASDWPYLKAPYRLDFGSMMAVYLDLFNLQECEQIMWHSPKKLLQFKT